MAKQSGIIKLKGTVGGISFYKSKDGYLAREKGGVDGDRIKNDPAFKRTRENGAEFGRAGAAGKLLRNAFRIQLLRSSDNRVTSRLTKQMLKVVQSDSVNQRGERTISEGDLELLLGFEFNKNSTLGSVLYAEYTAEINRETGEVTIEIPGLTALDNIVAPDGTTHFKIVAAAAEVNFEDGTFKVTTDSTEPALVSVPSTDDIELSCALHAGSDNDLFLVLGVEFYQFVNGTYNPMSQTSNALALVAVDAE